MAIDEHEDALRATFAAGNKEAWAEWRKKWGAKHPDEPIDLSGLELGRARLPGYDFKDVNLSGCDFHFANLEGVSFCDADISHAEFNEAFLYGANMHSVKNAHQALNLETVRTESISGGNRAGVIYFEECIRKWPERHASWDRVASFGRLCSATLGTPW